MKPTFLFRGLLAFGLFVTAELSVAGPFPPIAFLSMGFREARLSDFSRSAYVSRRREDPTAFLSVTADFNGDGRPDEARLLINQARQIAYVVAVIQTKQVDTYVLASYSLASAEKIGIRAAPPQSGSGRMGITVFDIQSDLGETSYFDGSEFKSTASVRESGS
ncbi:MAG TPA: hypothetical protein VIC34_03050 [Croceibacterium sp.]|jgi:hypothetical protein